MCKSHFLPTNDQRSSFWIVAKEVYFFQAIVHFSLDSLSMYYVAKNARCSAENLVRQRKQNNWCSKSSMVRSKRSCNRKGGRERRDVPQDNDIKCLSHQGENRI